MSKYLVIVESPAKAKTINKFLGSGYNVVASGGHVRDLPKSQMGFSPENDYEPKYITIRGKGDTLAMLRKEVKKADKVFLATDPDREGEAISWHLMQALKLDDSVPHRITFNEITKSAVKNSIRHPRKIDMNLVDAQQARRMLDRMVGYRISPLLWSKVKRGLSAGRVQSVALRIISDREKEIDDYIPSEYWTMDAELDADGWKKPVTAHLYGRDGVKLELKSRQEADRVRDDIGGQDFVVSEVKTGERKRKAPLPFTTSTLQQEASHRLNFSTQKTMRIAQQLYEGVDIKGAGMSGLITYLRTDSVRVSDEADREVRSFIGDNYGEDYVSQEQKTVITGQNIQDAHEAIRPTDTKRTPVLVKDSLSRDQFRLYQLIWNRFVASRMSDAVFETYSVRITAGAYLFTMSASHRTFDGFMSVYKTDEENESEDDDKNPYASRITMDSHLTLRDFDVKQHFTQPPAHFTEASLVKTMEELGIGRPSTYAPTLTTILARHYVVKENKNLYMTDLGDIVNSIMVQYFPSIVDIEFTANLEYLLDRVEDGTVKYKTIIRNFYPDLDEAVKEAEKSLEEVEIADEVSDVRCELCGRMMVVKYGPHGKFLACPGFPECRNTKTYYEKIGVSCPKCGKDIVIRKTKKGRRYYGCMGNPECDFMSWQRPSDRICPECGNILYHKGNKLVCLNESCGYITEYETENAM